MTTTTLLLLLLLLLLMIVAYSCCLCNGLCLRYAADAVVVTNLFYCIGTFRTTMHSYCASSRP